MEGNQLPGFLRNADFRLATRIWGNGVSFGPDSSQASVLSLEPRRWKERNNSASLPSDLHRHMCMYTEVLILLFKCDEANRSSVEKCPVTATERRGDVTGCWECLEAKGEGRGKKAVFSIGVPMESH